MKSVYPDTRVIWNDFDDYAHRLANISKTNQILADIRKILKDYPDRQRIIGKERDKILNRLRQEDNHFQLFAISSEIYYQF